jgi:hypothetical protein
VSGYALDQPRPRYEICMAVGKNGVRAPWSIRPPQVASRELCAIHAPYISGVGRCPDRIRYAVLISSTTSTTVSAHSPCRTAFCRDRCFPSSVIGPVLLIAFRRLASICRNEVISQPRRLDAARIVGLGRCRSVARAATIDELPATDQSRCVATKWPLDHAGATRDDGHGIAAR